MLDKDSVNIKDLINQKKISAKEKAARKIKLQKIRTREKLENITPSAKVVKNAVLAKTIKMTKSVNYQNLLMSNLVSSPREIITRHAEVQLQPYDMEIIAYRNIQEEFPETNFFDENEITENLLASAEKYRRQLGHIRRSVEEDD